MLEEEVVGETLQICSRDFKNLVIPANFSEALYKMAHMLTFFSYFI